MDEAPGSSRRWLRAGCVALAVVAIVLLVAAATLVGLSLLQNRSDRATVQRLEPSVGRVPAQLEPPSALSRIEVRVDVAALVVVPAPAGSPLGVEARYDPRRYTLTEETRGTPETGRTYRVGLRPGGSKAWALFKVKLGGAMSTLRLTLPRDVPLELVGEIDQGLAAVELGGLWVDSTSWNVRQGAVNVSFWEPLRHPMQRLSVTGDKGSLKISALGNASPRSTVLEQRLGELDLDFRGPWSNDAEIRIDGRIAGGSVWLPRNVILEGVDHRSGLPAPERPELPLPTLRLDISSRTTQLLIIE